MKVGFVSLGCPKNLVDGEVMLGLTREAEHHLTIDEVLRAAERNETHLHG